MSTRSSFTGFGFMINPSDWKFSWARKAIKYFLVMLVKRLASKSFACDFFLSLPLSLSLFLWSFPIESQLASDFVGKPGRVQSAQSGGKGCMQHPYGPELQKIMVSMRFIGFFVQKSTFYLRLWTNICQFRAICCKIVAPGYAFHVMATVMLRYPLSWVTVATGAFVH